MVDAPGASRHGAVQLPGELPALAGGQGVAAADVAQPTGVVESAQQEGVRVYECSGDTADDRLRGASAAQLGPTAPVRRNIVTGETEYLGIVGEDYGVVQNEQCVEILDRLVDEVGGAHSRPRAAYAAADRCSSP
jgi:hypothetical protein